MTRGPRDPRLVTFAHHIGTIVGTVVLCSTAIAGAWKLGMHDVEQRLERQEHRIAHEHAERVAADSLLAVTVHDTNELVRLLAIIRAFGESSDEGKLAKGMIRRRVQFEGPTP